MRTFKLVLAVIILVLLLIFSANNYQPVHVRFLGLQTGELPLFLVILFCFVLGFVAAALLGTVRTSQLRRQIQRLEREITVRREEETAGGPPAGSR